MKKYLAFSLMVLATVCVGFSSCSKDDDENTSGNEDTSGNIVGKWSLVALTLDGENQGVSEGDFLEIKSDGTFLEQDVWVDGHGQMAGTWKQVNGKLQIEYDNRNSSTIYLPISYTIIKLNDNSLVLSAMILGFIGTKTYQR